MNHALLLSMLLVEPSGAGLHFVDVGQGSAMVAIGPEGDVLVFDSGPPSGAEPLLRALPAWMFRRAAPAGRAR